MFEVKNLAYVLTALEAIEKTFIYSRNVVDADEFWI